MLARMAPSLATSRLGLRSSGTGSACSGLRTGANGGCRTAEARRSRCATRVGADRRAARRQGGRPRRGGGRARRARPSQLPADPASHGADLRGGRALADGRDPGGLHGLRPAAPRRPQRELPYPERRALLDGLGLDGPRWHVPGWHRGGGANLFEAARAPGTRGRGRQAPRQPLPARQALGEWIKARVWQRQEFVIGGTFQVRDGAPRPSAPCWWATTTSGPPSSARTRPRSWSSREAPGRA